MKRIRLLLVPAIALYLMLLVGVTLPTTEAGEEASAVLPMEAVEPSPATSTMVEELTYHSPKPAPTPKQWTDEEAEVLAKMLWGEARGVPSDMEKAACIWCVLNRCDAYGKSIIEVVTAPYQFVGYRAENPVDEELLALCEDVLSRYYAEKNGQSTVGRVLPQDYLYFTGDGKRNYFRNEFVGGTTFDWSLTNPYEN